MMKLSSVFSVLSVISGCTAYSVSRSSLRSLGQKSFASASKSRQNVGASITMEGKNTNRARTTKDREVELRTMIVTELAGPMCWAVNGL